VCLGFLCHGVHRQTNRHSREISEIVPAHTRARAHTQAQITHTPLSWHHTNMHTCVSEYVYICYFLILFLSIPYSCLPNSLFLLDTGCFFLHALTLAHTLLLILPTGTLCLRGISSCARLREVELWRPAPATPAHRGQISTALRAWQESTRRWQDQLRAPTVYIICLWFYLYIFVFVCVCVGACVWVRVCMLLSCFIYMIYSCFTPDFHMYIYTYIYMYM
jgi:hypothetical protein